MKYLVLLGGLALAVGSSHRVDALEVAIERFERERRLPITGQISDRFTRELAAVTGRPLE